MYARGVSSDLRLLHAAFEYLSNLQSYRLGVDDSFVFLIATNERLSIVIQSIEREEREREREKKKKKEKDSITTCRDSRTMWEKKTGVGKGTKR